MRVLLVDDSLIFRKAQTKVLKSLGITDIVEAENGLVALQTLASLDYDINLIILDINMPVLSGIDTLKELRKVNSEIPVIMCTSEAGKENIMASLKAGANTYLLKPVNKDDMQQKIAPFITK